jgi:pilus assembly protein CpaB
MNRLDKKAVIALGAGLAAALAATLLFVAFQSLGAPKETSPAVVQLRVVKALQEIPEGSTIASEMVGFTTIPAEKAGTDLIVDPDQVLDRKAEHTIASGDVLKKSDVERSMSPGIPEGYVAMSLKLDTVSGVTWMLKARDMVDVVGVLRPVSSSDKRGKVSTILLQALRVFSVEAPEAKKGKQVGVTEKGTVTLLMTPKQAQKLMLISAAGEYTLALRGKGDEAEYKTLPVSVRDLIAVKRAAPRRSAVPRTTARRVTIVEVK